MTSAKSRLLLLGGLFVLSGSAFVVFTISIGQGRVTGPGVFLAGSVGMLGVVAYLLIRTAQALVETGVDAEAREEKAATGRRRKELEREYNALKRAIKELELDYSMGKLSEQDYTPVRSRYRERAVRILRQLDQGESYRAQIDRDLQARLKAKGIVKKSTDAGSAAAVTATSHAKLDSSAATPKKDTETTDHRPSGSLAAQNGTERSSPRVLPPGYESSIISEEPTKAADAFAMLTATRQSAHADSLPPGYEPSIISEEPTKAVDGFRAAAGKSLVHREGMTFNGESATVMRAVANLTGGNVVSTELTQQTLVPPLPGLTTGPTPAQRNEPTQQTLAPCASCGATNDADANFCKKCGARLHP